MYLVIIVQFFLWGMIDNMMPKELTLSNEFLQVQVLLDWYYKGSRYDWGGTIGQVTVNGHTFLSKEQNADGSTGLGGIGLTNVWEWTDTSIYDRTAMADYFPLPGVGLLKKVDTSPFLFTKTYQVEPYKRQISVEQDSVTIRTLPYFCQNTAMETVKSYHLEKNKLVVSFHITNTGSEEIHATEFCHNFFQFDGHPIDGTYCLRFPYSIQPELRRGELVISRDRYRLGAFDAPTNSTAFWIKGWQGLQHHWMELSNETLGMSVLIEDLFPVCRFYSWNNPWAFCPETFAPIDLAPGEETSYSRVYHFSA